MVKKILLVCAGGFSTSMLVEKMKEVANQKGLDVLIHASGEGSFEQKLPVDVILLGPQMGHMQKSIAEKVDLGVPVRIIGMMDYGMMNGEKVLNDALDLIKKNR